MDLEKFVSNMMTMNVNGRIWHWATDIAQHHLTYEKFLTENEALTDSFVESVLGNQVKFDINALSVNAALKGGYDLSAARTEISKYRASIGELQQNLEGQSLYGAELITILDGAIELCSKTLYLLNLK